MKIRLLICILLVSGCSLFAADDDVDTGHWTCRATICVTDTSSGDGHSDLELCQTDSTPILIHADSKAVAKNKCLDVFPETTLQPGDVADSTCDCSKGVQDNLNLQQKLNIIRLLIYLALLVVCGPIGEESKTDIEAYCVSQNPADL